MATLEVQLQPFELPTGVRVKVAPGLKQDGIRANPEIRIRDLPIGTLEALINEFKLSLLAEHRAGIEARIRADDPT